MSTQTIYAGEYAGGAYKSTDGGINWAAINTGLTNNAVYILMIDPTATQTIYAGTGGNGVYKSTDGGSNWVASNIGMETVYITFLAIDPASPKTIYGGALGLFKLLPHPAWDTEADAKSDIGVRRPDTCVRYILLSGTPGSYIATQWGSQTDVAISSLPGFCDPFRKSLFAIFD